MRTVMLQGSPGSEPPEQIQWLTDRVRDLAEASSDNQTTDIAGAFSITGAFTTARSLNTGTATLADVINVLCTLITDLQRGGSSRSL